MKQEIEISPRLKELEVVIQHGFDGFEKAGNALIEIRDARLYKGTHDTFEAYCRERWDMSRPRAYQLMNAAEISNNVSTIVDIKPTRESHVRSLAGLNPIQQVKIWKQAVGNANGKAPTAKQVAAAKAQTLDELVPRIKQNLAKLAAADIKAAVYHVFETSQKEMKRFKTKPEQQKFKTAALEFLKNKLIPSTPVSTKRKGKNHYES